MSPRPTLQGFVALGVAVVQAVACTLTSDPFTPQLLDRPLQASPAVDESPLTPAQPVDVVTLEPDLSCSSGSESSSEVLGCGIALSPIGGCDADLDCESNACVDGACVAASCEDGRRNPGEADVDCGGGSCPACAVGASCDRNADCQTGVCGEGGTCARASCDDRISNQNETGVDCGGACPDCPTGEPCGTGRDCQSGVCSPAGCEAGVARCCQAPRCDDNVQNGNEPVTDCGNAACGPCPDGSPCGANVQCVSGLCQAGSCRRPPCADGVRNGSETDTDCGGNDPACARCALGEGCAGNADCASGSCIAGSCADCDDGRLDGNETGVDCGGACGPCAPGGACRVDGDCQSAVCQDGRCCGGTQVDCTRCARRLAPVINCNTNGPAGAANCDAFLDCLAANPNLCPVRHAPGCSEDPGGVCNHTAFGGNTGPGLGLADAILGTAACFF